MAEQPKRRTLILPIDLGSPAQYDQSVFPLSRVQGRNSIGQMDLFLEATLDEIFKIRQMEGNAENFQRLIKNAKTQYDDLLREKRKVEQQQKSLNPVKKFSAYRSVRLLLEAGKALYTETRTVSEKMRRQLLSQGVPVNTEDVHPVEYDDLPSNAHIGGVAIPLDSEFQPDESTASFFAEAASFITSQVNLLGEGDPFADEHGVEHFIAEHEPSPTTSPAPTTSDGEVATSTSSRLSGASGNNYFFFQNSYVASRSAIQTPTLNSGGSHNQGSSVHR